ncbi:Y-family DNA polymerase [Parasphingopyxis marina]|uniref:Y-family DNA polymerase n=1 Tax=Parasphingopyxis marina TaxID=2761622 RepID=UPI001F22A91F|nr:DNA polymerase Y family protein [Parasphingopyxis marina]
MALWFPFLPADRLKIAARPASPAPPEPPLAFAEKVKGAMRLAAVNRVARRLGLVPGLTLADARARVPDLAVRDFDPDADARWLDRLVQGCARYTPMAAAAPPDALILDITGCAHLFGGEAALEADAMARLKRLGMTVRPARANTAEAAHALARWGDGETNDEVAAIRRLPVIALGLDPEGELGLRRAGLKTVDAVAKRPRAAIAARFGKAAVTALERLLGETRGPLSPRLPLGAIHAERRFPEPVARTEYALGILGELAHEAAEELRQRNRGGRRFEAVFFRSDGLAQRIAIEFGRPVRDPEAVMRLFDERIESLGDPLDPGFGFDAIRLLVLGEEVQNPSQIALDGGEIDENEVAALIDRLSIRIGRGNLMRFEPRDTHIPEAAQRLVPAIAGGQSDSKADGWPQPEPGEPPRRPLQLFDPPEPVAVIAEVPDGPPWRFQWRGKQHEVIGFEGPERIASEWWRSPGDPLGEKRLTRDYYRVEDSEGRRYWLFRHGLYGQEKADPGWYLHGLFA